MNPLIIILGVIVIFLLYQLYFIYTSAPTVANNIYLGSTTQVPAINSGSISLPNNSTYTFAFWIYINTFSQNIDEFIGFGNMGDSTIAAASLKSDLNSSLPTSASTTLTTKVTNPQNVCTFSMDNNSPTLFTNITTTDSNQNTYIVSVPITNNLPVQTWTYVLVSVSTVAGPYVDCYINGKLVTSQQLAFNNSVLSPYNPQTPSSSNINTVLFAKSPSNSSDRDVYLTKISWIPNPVDPQTAWYYYNQGNGNPTGSGALSTYHLEVDFIKDSTVYPWKIF